MFLQRGNKIIFLKEIGSTFLYLQSLHSNIVYKLIDIIVVNNFWKLTADREIFLFFNYCTAGN